MMVIRRMRCRDLQYGIAIGCRTDGYLGTDVSGRARSIIDDNLLAEIFRELLCNEPRDGV